jgi:hypothetical protein
LSAADPSDDDLVAFAELLLQKVQPQLRQRHVLEEAIRQNRATWLTLYETARVLKTLSARKGPQ